MLQAHLSAAMAAALMIAAPQAPPSETAATAPSAETAATSGPATVEALAPGMPVKDRIGAVIGSVLDVGSDDDGKRTATIRMGVESFAIDAASLTVRDGAARVDATEAELKGLPKPR